MARPLPGAGPLVVQTKLAGLTYAGQTQAGHHFVDATGTTRLRIGNATAVDSAGRVWPLTTQVDEKGLVVSVPQAVLAEATYQLAIDPVISPEFEMDDPVLVPSVGLTPACAAKGTNYWVV